MWALEGVPELFASGGWEVQTVDGAECIVLPPGAPPQPLVDAVMAAQQPSPQTSCTTEAQTTSSSLWSTCAMRVWRV